MNYYNEFDPYAAQWLRNLIAAGLIPAGDVDERSIEDVKPDDLRDYTQCHFFAGIGGWSLALRLAGWPDDRPVWTGSCPCQPFSAAGKRAGFADERHLWPQFHYLIEQCRPPVVFGEQVASKDGLAWLDLVQADLEGTGYACGAVDLCAAGVGAPHIRQRLWWVAQRLADADSAGSLPGAHARIHRAEKSDGTRHGEPKRYGAIGGLADAAEFGRERGRSSGAGAEPGAVERSSRLCTASAGPSSASPTNGFWRDSDWLFCRDGLWRPVEPGTFPLANGVAARVGRLRAYGNAIVPQVAAEFVMACECIEAGE